MKLKKIGSLLLALVMCLGLMSVAWAADDTTYTVKIENDRDGYVYAAYQIFSGVIAEEKNEQGVVTHTYLSGIEWGTGIDGTAFLVALQADDAFLVPVEGEDPDETVNAFASCTSAGEVADVLSTYTEFAEEFAKVAANYVTTEANVSGTKEEPNWNEDGYYTISNLDAGYYLILNTVVPEGDEIYDGAYTGFILKVLEDETVQHKGSVPEIDKVITDNDENQAGLNYDPDKDYTSASTGVVGDYTIGDTVPYTIYVTLPDQETWDLYDTYKLVINDKMTSGLTFDGEETVKVTVNGQTVTGYEFAFDEETNSFTITFEDAKTAGLNAEDVIEISFTATLNSNAVVAVAEVNETWLEYDNNPNAEGTGESPHIKVYAFTFELDVNKVTSTGAGLEGASFVLKNADKTAYIAVYDAKTDELIKNSQDITDDTDYYFKWITAADAETSGDGQNVTIFKSDEQGNFSIVGLDEGTYYLEEIEAPNGYNLLGQDIGVIIVATYSKDSNGVVSLDYITVTVDTTGVSNSGGTGDSGNQYGNGKGVIDVVNNHGDELPSTGGIGTTIFYIIGGVLVVGAAVVLIARRRMSRDAE